jgi:hypothetical protein
LQIRPTNSEAQLGGQLFQIGCLPLLNTLLYRNSPGLIAADRLFSAFARASDAPSGLNDTSLFEDNGNG